MHHPLPNKLAVALVLILLATPLGRTTQGEEFLSNETLGIALKHQQQWGDFGLDTAAAKPGTKGSPLRIGEQTFKRGLGHHANGEINVDLDGQFNEFRATIGVQWQGGNKGSVTFQIATDDDIVFESQPMSDSDPAQEVQIPLQGIRQLRLIATDSGDGIGCDMANWAEARLVRDSHLPFFGPITASLAGQPAPPSSANVCGFSIIANESGPQVAVMEPAGALTVATRNDEEVRFVILINNIVAPLQISADVDIVHGKQAEVELVLGTKKITKRINDGDSVLLTTELTEVSEDCTLTLITRGIGGETGVRWQRLRCTSKDQLFDIPLAVSQQTETFPPPVLPAPRPAIQQQLVEWDWRMQDGIETSREPRSWKLAIQKVLQQGDLLIQDLEAARVSLVDSKHSWEELRAEWQTLSTNNHSNESSWEDLWRRIHVLRRRIVFENPLANVGPLLFVKRVPASFSHQLTQYLGMCARPGGGVFVLDHPGESMQCRQLASLPNGSYQHPEVSWDGDRVLFAFCEADAAPADRRSNQERKYHLYEVRADGSNQRQLTTGDDDDFSPRYLPDGKILFLSTRRGGFHRCGAGPCPVYTMALIDPDGSNPKVISFHETHEWDPAVLNDGRIIYTRWDYVDRNAVHYQQLWSARPDGSDVRAFYGNNTFNPVGVWEARPVPDSNLVMATAGAHHAMTAGSIVLLDVSRGIDGQEPITRLTPDALFPESEFRVQRWHAPTGVPTEPTVPAEELRWPGHCYRTPYPLSEDYFLAAYSFDPLIGEPNANTPNMFGLYLVDRFGNKELLYRDLNIGSLWPTPLRARTRPPMLASTLNETHKIEGTFFVQNVYESWPKLPADVPIRELRVVQVLPKTTPHANTPKLGLANASPGKQVLGTVPVESDGLAYFRAPAEIPLLFQVLDEQGMAVQTMRSLTYLQPGEHATCIGCHQYRNQVPDARLSSLAKTRPPSTITAGPEGSKPLSYPILVQPVLDKHCVECHSGPKAEGGIALSGKPEGQFTESYNALAPLVAISEWNGSPKANSEPRTYPDRFGARASELMTLLLEGHEGVELSEDDIHRLATWMDANALFYGTFNVEDQKRQQTGEHIAGPELQ